MAINYILKTLCKTFTTLLLWLCLDYFKHFEWGMYFFRLGTTFLGWTKCVDYFMEYLSKRGTSARRNFSWNFHLKIKKKKKMIFVNFRVFFFSFTPWKKRDLTSLPICTQHRFSIEMIYYCPLYIKWITLSPYLPDSHLQQRNGKKYTFFAF